MNVNPIIQIENLSRTYGDSFSLFVESLLIETGESFCLVGPTGSGKSTLLKQLAGIDLGSSGSIEFAGESRRECGFSISTYRCMTMVFQNPLMLNTTLRKNVEYGLKLRGKQNSKRVDSLLKKLGLSRFTSQSARTLSGGQTQLVALARALILEPDLLILDEPTANLDPAHVALMEEVILEDRKSRGTTLVWATHNLFQAKRVADRVGFLLDGKMVEVAQTAVFFENASDSRTADFVQGKMIY